MKTAYIAGAAFAALSLLAAPALAGHHAKGEKKDILATAKANPQFSTLATAIQQAGIADTLSSSGNLTVFAPTNDAFDALPSGTLDSLLKPENKDKLIDILTYHVVEGKVTASEAMKLDSAASLEGSMINITVEGETVMVNDAKVIKADVMASNGVIHAIDKVIMPSESDSSSSY